MQQLHLYFNKTKETTFSLIAMAVMLKTCLSKYSPVDQVLQTMIASMPYKLSSSSTPRVIAATVQVGRYVVFVKDDEWIPTTFYFWLLPGPEIVHQSILYSSGMLTNLHSATNTFMRSKKRLSALVIAKGARLYQVFIGLHCSVLHRKWANNDFVFCRLINVSKYLLTIEFIYLECISSLIELVEYMRTQKFHYVCCQIPDYSYYYYYYSNVVEVF